MNQLLSYILQFFLGGGIIVGMSILTKHANPKWAALLYALPIQFTIALFFIAREHNKQTTQTLIMNSIFALIIMLVFLIAMYILMIKTNLITSAIISYLLLLVMFIIWLNVEGKL